MHTMLVVVHAVSAVLAAAAGARSLVRPRWVDAYLACLVVSGLALTTVAVVAPSPGLRIVDLALVGLFVVVVARAVLARRVPRRDRRTSVRFVGGVGFGLIALTDGFVVVAVLDLGAPVWAVVAAGLGVAVVGHLWLTRLLRRRGEVWVQEGRHPLGSAIRSSQARPSRT